jgi:hypothetical protein
VSPSVAASQGGGSHGGTARRKKRKPTNRAAPEAAARFRVLLPATWMILPLAPEGRHQKIRRLVRRRVGTSDELAGARYQAALELERAAEAAVDAGVFFAATYDELFEDVPVSASLTVSVTPTGLSTGSPDRSNLPPGDVSGDAPRGQEGQEGQDQPEGERDRSQLAQLMVERLEKDRTDHHELSVREIPLGPAVRCRSHARAELYGSDGRELRPATLQYLVPLASSDHMLVMSFSTPILPLADRFAELFDAMARTARID